MAADIYGATTDSNGDATLSFDTAGTYIISATGTAPGPWGNDVFFGVPYCVITVAPATEPEPELDTEAPELADITVTRKSALSLEVSFVSDEAGAFYYALGEAADASGEGAAMSEGENSFTVKLQNTQATQFYLAAKDDAGNITYADAVSIDAYEANRVAVQFAFFNPASGTNGGFDVLWHEITVSEGTAELFGAGNAPAGTVVGGVDHGVAIGEITPLDALIAAHVEKYGNDFAVGDQLRLTSTNYVTKLFGVSGDIAYVVNGISPTGDMSDGYAANEYVLQDGDRVMFYSSGSGMYGLGDFSSYFNMIEASVLAGEALELTLSGHEALYAMSWSTEGTPTKAYTVYAMADVSVVAVDPATGLLGTQVLGTTDGDGKVSLTFDEPGTYFISAFGEVENNEWYGMEFPILGPWCAVTVTEAPEILYDVTGEVGPSTVKVEFFKTAGFDASGCDIPGAGIEAVNNGVVSSYRNYKLSLPAGTYSYRGTDASGNDLGGMTFKIPTANANTAALTDTVTLRQTEIYPSNNIDGTYMTGDDYRVAVGYGDKLVINGAETYKSGNFYRTRTLLVTGSYDIAFDITNEALESKVLPYTLSGRAVARGTGINAIAQALPTLFTLTVPEGASPKVYGQVNNYNNSYYEPIDIKNNGDGTFAYVYSGLTGNLMYRVSTPDKITKAGYFATANSGYAITFGENENPKDTTNTAVIANNENSTMVNINEDNHLALAVGEEFRLRGYRAAWQIVNNTVSNIMIEPDFHFDVIYESAEGMLDVVPHADRSNWADITALKAGTAIIEVSYDAIDVAGASDGRYGATHPHRKSLVVVTVGEDAADVIIDLVTDYKDGVWDTEFDTFYMLGSSAVAPITLDAAGAQVTVWNPDVAGSEHSAAESDGVYPATLYPGNNIVKVVYGGKTSYKVVRAAVLTPVIANVTEGKEANDPIEAGDSITIHFGGLFMPIPKLSGIYNPAFMAPRAQVLYKTPSGDTVTTTGLQYNFISANLMSLTIPEDASGEYVLTGGYTPTTNMGSGPSQHRAIVDTGVGVNMGASNADLMFSLLPDIAIEIYTEPVAADSDFAFELEAEDRAYNVGDTVSVDVYLTSDEAEVIRAMELTVTFDELLDYSKMSFALAGLRGNRTAGGIRLVRTDNDVAFDGRLLIATLEFVVTGDFTDTAAARFAIADGAYAANAYTGPDQSIAADVGEAVEVQLYNLTVTFHAGTGVIMDTAIAYVRYGESTLYTDSDYETVFTVPAPLPSAGYRLSSPYWSYTEGVQFTGSAEFTASAVKVWAVQFCGPEGQIGDTQIIDEGQSATAPDDLDDTATERFAGWVVGGDTANIYTKAQIDELAVTGDIVYSAHFVGIRFALVVPEGVVITGGAELEDGVWYATYGEDVTFTLGSDTEYGYVAIVSIVAGGAELVLTPDADGVYRIPGNKIAEGLEIKVKYVINGVVSFIVNDDYRAAPASFKVMRLRLGGDAIENATYKYGGKTLFWSEKYEAYVAMVDESLTAEEALADITAEPGGEYNIAITYSGDVVIMTNAPGINAMDAQVVYDLYVGMYSDSFDLVTELNRLEADVTGDGTVSILDVWYIQSIILGISG